MRRNIGHRAPRVFAGGHCHREAHWESDDRYGSTITELLRILKLPFGAPRGTFLNKALTSEKRHPINAKKKT